MGVGVSVAEMAAHVEDLCAAHGIAVGSHSAGGRASRSLRQVRFRPVRTQVTYAVALHELGHVLGAGQWGPRLVAEAEAWRWALAAALEVREPFRAAACRSLLSYLRWAEARQHRRHGRPVIPDGGVFWETLSAVGGPASPAARESGSGC